MNTPDVIMSETSNGTRYAIAKSTDLKAMEKKYPAMIQPKIHLSFSMTQNLKADFSHTACRSNVHNENS